MTNMHQITHPSKTCSTLQYSDEHVTKGRGTLKWTQEPDEFRTIRMGAWLILIKMREVILLTQHFLLDTGMLISPPLARTLCDSECCEVRGQIRKR